MTLCASDSFHQDSSKNDDHVRFDDGAVLPGRRDYSKPKKNRRKKAGLLQHQADQHGSMISDQADLLDPFVERSDLEAEGDPEFVDPQKRIYVQERSKKGVQYPGRIHVLYMFYLQFGCFLMVNCR